MMSDGKPLVMQLIGSPKKYLNCCSLIHSANTGVRGNDKLVNERVDEEIELRNNR